jgi:hypothetical protein
MTDFIVILILVLICGAAARYIYKAKKNGAKCIGCAAGGNGCSCSCGSSASKAACSGCSHHIDSE